MQPPSCTPRVKVTPLTRGWSKLTQPRGANPFTQTATDGAHSGSYKILDKTWLTDTWESLLAVSFSIKVLSDFLRRF